MVHLKNLERRLPAVQLEADSKSFDFYRCLRCQSFFSIDPRVYALRAYKLGSIFRLFKLTCPECDCRHFEAVAELPTAVDENSPLYFASLRTRSKK